MGDQNSAAENNEFETNCDFFKLLPLGPEIDIHFLRIILNPYENNISNCQKIKNIFPESPVEFTRTMVKNMNTNYIYRCGNGNK